MSTLRERLLEAARMYRRSSPLATLNGFTQNADLLEEAAAALERQGEDERYLRSLVGHWQNKANYWRGVVDQLTD